jgi:hypothetical protein
VFISGSLVNLRETASTTATVLKKVPMGTECVVEEKTGSGWWRIGCGDTQGWVKTELLATERPTLEPLLDLAEDSKQPLKDRFDAALRATALDPEHSGARTLLWHLFAEQERAQFENIHTREPDAFPRIHVALACLGDLSTEECIKMLLEVGSSIRWHHLELHDRQQPGERTFVSAALDKNDPPQLWVRTGTFKGDSKDLDLQVFTQSRYVPSDALKSALEKLPEPPPKQQDEESRGFSKLQGVLTAGERLMASLLMGTWTQLTRRSGRLVIQRSCAGDPMQIRVDDLGGQVRAYLQFGEDGTDFDVVGVEFNNGTTVFKKLNGGTLKHAISREDKRVSTWTYVEYEPLNGLFVHSAVKDAFPVVEPEKCDDFH